MNANMEERELLSGMLSRRASFRLLVVGEVDVRELIMLIRKLEIDKEILGKEDLGKRIEVVTESVR